MVGAGAHQHVAIQVGRVGDALAHACADLVHGDRRTRVIVGVRLRVQVRVDELPMEAASVPIMS